MNDGFKVGDRVVVLSTIKDIKMGKIATLEEIMPNDIGIIRHDVDPETSRDKLVGIPLSSLRKATVNEVQRVKNKDRLLNKQYRTGQKWRINKGFKLNDSMIDEEVVTIVGYKLSDNYNDDMYIIATDQTLEPTPVKRSTLNNHFIYYNPELEESLGQELGDHGQMFDLNTGKRVKVKEQVFCDNVVNIINVDDVALIMEIYDNVGEVQLGINTLNPPYEAFGYTDLTNIYPASLEDIQRVNYKTIVDKKLWIGNRLMARDVIQNVFHLNSYVQPNDVVTILDIRNLGSYVLEDKFEVQIDGTDNLLELSAYDLHSYFAPVELETKEVEEPVMMLDVAPSTPIPAPPAQIAVHDFTVNGFRFRVSSNNEISSDEQVEFSAINDYIAALQQAVQFIQSLQS